MRRLAHVQEGHEHAASPEAALVLPLELIHMKTTMQMVTYNTKHILTC